MQRPWIVAKLHIFIAGCSRICQKDWKLHSKTISRPGKPVSSIVSLPHRDPGRAGAACMGEAEGVMQTASACHVRLTTCSCCAGGSDGHFQGILWGWRSVQRRRRPAAQRQGHPCTSPTPAHAFCHHPLFLGTSARPLRMHVLLLARQCCISEARQGLRTSSWLQKGATMVFSR